MSPFFRARGPVSDGIPQSTVVVLLLASLHFASGASSAWEWWAVLASFGAFASVGELRVRIGAALRMRHVRRMRHAKL
jgi:hypothetical protein